MVYGGGTLWDEVQSHKKPKGGKLERVPQVVDLVFKTGQKLFQGQFWPKISVESDVPTFSRPMSLRLPCIALGTFAVINDDGWGHLQAISAALTSFDAPWATSSGGLTLATFVGSK